MKKTTIFMATDAIMILAAACGQQQSKTQHNEVQRNEKNRSILEAYK